MLRYILTAFAVTLTLFTATSANAQVTGSREKMTFVADTSLKDPKGNALTLCHLIDQQIIFFVPIYTRLEDYALATNRCDAGNFFPISRSEIMAAQLSGRIPSSVPATPLLDPKIVKKNDFVLTAGSILSILVILLVAFRMFRKFGRGEPAEISDDFGVIHPPEAHFDRLPTGS